MKNNDANAIQKAKERYQAAMHAMQSGVKFLLNYEAGETAETSPKHLRVGVNAALIDSGALGALLMRKGIITELEYFETLAELAEQDAKSYQQELAKHIGKTVNLA